jgi:hypothetical protein
VSTATSLKTIKFASNQRVKFIGGEGVVKKLQHESASWNYVIEMEMGMAFVLIQHLSPNYESLLSEILGRVTAMPVRQVQDRMMVEPNQVYV